MSDDRTQRTAQFWEQSHAADSTADVFLEHPLIHTYISLRAFGSTRSHLQVAIDEIRAHTAPGARLLSIGCGWARKEQTLCQALPNRTIVGVDITSNALDRARGEAEAAGITNLALEYGDFNALDLDPRSYDMVLALGALHHVEQLEAFWEQCRRGLCPGGRVLAQEYVGPSRFQWTDAQVEHSNRVLAALVPRTNRSHDRPVRPVDLEQLIAADPSEAVRSDEIVSTCRTAGWTIEDYRGGGCGLLQPTLTDHIPTFDHQNWDHSLVLFTLFKEEQALIAAGTVSDTYAMFTATP